jgi:hypothetical protein
MITIVNTNGDQYTFNDEAYLWVSETDPDTAALLTDMLNPAGPSGADPDPEFTIAQEALTFLGGGEVVSYERPTYEDEAAGGLQVIF